MIRGLGGPPGLFTRAASFRRRDDIAFMTAVTIQAINAHRDLVIWIGFAAGGMTDRDLVTADLVGERASAIFQWVDIAFMRVVTI